MLVLNMSNALMVPLLVLSMAFLTQSAVPQDTKYTTKYDNIEIDDVVSNERLLKNYVNCLLEKGSCTPDGLELKKNMPDAIATDCSKCSEKQKEGSDKIIKFLIDNRPEYWTPLQQKYDPSGSYKKRYLESKEDVQVKQAK